MSPKWWVAPAPGVISSRHHRADSAPQGALCISRQPQRLLGSGLVVREIAPGALAGAVA